MAYKDFSSRTSGEIVVGKSDVVTALIARPVIGERVCGRRVYYDNRSGLQWGSYMRAGPGGTVESNGLAEMIDDFALHVGFGMEEEVTTRILTSSDRARTAVLYGLGSNGAAVTRGKSVGMDVYPVGIVLGRYDAIGPLLRAAVQETNPQMFVMVRDGEKKTMFYDNPGGSVGSMCSALSPHMGGEVFMESRRGVLTSLSKPYTGPHGEREELWTWDGRGRPVSRRIATLLAAGLMLFPPADMPKNKIS